jgi:uncharacterized UBP type Zn finger protein
MLLIHGTTTYELRGAICFQCGKSGLRTSVGHYTVYLKISSGRKWELSNDMKKKTSSSCEYSNNNVCIFDLYNLRHFIFCIYNYNFNYFNYYLIYLQLI